MKSNNEPKMGLILGFVTGLMFGVEFYEDEDASYFIMDIGIIRFVFYKDHIE